MSEPQGLDKNFGVHFIFTSNFFIIALGFIHRFDVARVASIIINC